MSNITLNGFYNLLTFLFMKKFPSVQKIAHSFLEEGFLLKTCTRRRKVDQSYLCRWISKLAQHYRAALATREASVVNHWKVEWADPEDRVRSVGFFCLRVGVLVKWRFYL